MFDASLLSELPGATQGHAGLPTLAKITSSREPRRRLLWLQVNELIRTSMTFVTIVRSTEMEP